MDVFEAIYGRQSMGKMKPDDLPRELVEQLLAAGVQAPNHYKVRPWRFIVLSGSARERLGDVLVESLKSRFPEIPEEGLLKEKNKPLRAPVLIAVAVDKPSEPKVEEVENICATAAACQNILLAAHALGLAGMWRSGGPVHDPLVKEFLGVELDQKLIGFLYIGWPEFEPEPKVRPSFEDRVVWMS